MTNEEFVRQAYARAEVRDLPQGVLPPTGVLGHLDAALQQHAHA